MKKPGEAVWLSIVVVCAVVMASIGFYLHVKVNQARFPDAPYWTHFFK